MLNVLMFILLAVILMLSAPPASPAPRLPRPECPPGTTLVLQGDGRDGIVWVCEPIVDQDGKDGGQTPPAPEPPTPPSPDKPDKPGNGWGDKNHDHEGPPGKNR